MTAADLISDAPSSFSDPDMPNYLTCACCNVTKWCTSNQIMDHYAACREANSVRCSGCSQWLDKGTELCRLCVGQVNLVLATQRIKHDHALKGDPWTRATSS